MSVPNTVYGADNTLAMCLKDPLKRHDMECNRHNRLNNLDEYHDIHKLA